MRPDAARNAAFLPLVATLILLTSCAETTPNVIDLSVEVSGLTLYGGAGQGALGLTVAAGDVNGDGVDDLLIAAPTADVESRIAAGTFYIVFGGSDLDSTDSIDLTREADVTVFGAAQGDHLGRALAIGDVNGDGIQDILAGAWLADAGGRFDAGEAYVFYGRSEWPAEIDLDVDAADVTIKCDQISDQCAHAVVVADVNADEIGDIIIGVWLDDGPAGLDTGSTYIIYGHSALPTVIDLSLVPPDVTIYGEQAGERNGYQTETADLNGDAIADLILGVWSTDALRENSTGSVYVVYGSPVLPAIIDLSIYPSDLTIRGRDYDDEAGRAITAADVTGDTIIDLIVAANHGDGPGEAVSCGPTQAGELCASGEIYVFYGGTSWPSEIDLSDTSADTTIYAVAKSDQLGRTVETGDFNGDGIHDLIVGAWAADPDGRMDAGSVVVFYGGSQLDETILLGEYEADLAIYGRDVGDRLGRGLATGDLNGDGADDIIVGAHLGDGPRPIAACTAQNPTHDQCDAGEAYVIFGDPG